MTDHLATYLNDHLAGAVAGLEIVDHILDAVNGTPMEATVSRLKIDIEEDRDALATLIKRLDIGESNLRKAAAWMGEKAAELKMRFDDPSEGSLRLFASLEALSIGISGKLCLWRALAAFAPDEPRLQPTDYDLFIQRAEEQHTSVEDLRITAAKSAFTDDNLKGERDAPKDAPK